MDEENFCKTRFAQLVHKGNPRKSRGIISSTIVLLLELFDHKPMIKRLRMMRLVPRRRAFLYQLCGTIFVPASPRPSYRPSHYLVLLLATVWEIKFFQVFSSSSSNDSVSHQTLKTFFVVIIKRTKTFFIFPFFFWVCLPTIYRFFINSL